MNVGLEWNEEQRAVVQQLRRNPKTKCFFVDAKDGKEGKPAKSRKTAAAGESLNATESRSKTLLNPLGQSEGCSTHSVDNSAALTKCSAQAKHDAATKKTTPILHCPVWVLLTENMDPIVIEGHGETHL